MKRIHIGLQVSDLAASTKFYSTLFGAAPSVQQADYVKWMLDDPRVNFSITACCDVGGNGDKVHFGIQVEEGDDLRAVTERLASAGLAVRETPDVNCCYAHSDKTWSADPDGFPWETFLTHGQTTTYGEETLTERDIQALSESSRAGCGCAAGEKSAGSKDAQASGPACC